MNTCLHDSVVLHLHSEKYPLEAVAQVSVMYIHAHRHLCNVISHTTRISTPV